MAVDYSRINNTMGKMLLHLSTHESVCVGVSGGSDSNIIVHIIATYFRQFLPKVHFVFCNTGLEYRATLRHLKYMEEHYNIKIDRIRGDSVVTVIKKYGVPIVSKHFSEMVELASRGGKSAMLRIERKHYYNGKLSPFNFSEKQNKLAMYLLQNKIPVSNKCCKYSKKYPNQRYLKKIKADLSITGERKAEGGIRALQHKDCFETGKISDKYMPLFFWNDETKQWYKEHEKIVYSDCYEVWGMTRTGCVGCPFDKYIADDLKLIKKYEPNLYKACIKLFGESYMLMDKFNMRKHKILEEDNEQLEGQISLFDEGNND